VKVGNLGCIQIVLHLILGNDIPANKQMGFIPEKHLLLD
jgi:hypothetical protein